MSRSWYTTPAVLLLVAVGAAGSASCRPGSETAAQIPGGAVPRQRDEPATRPPIAERLTVEVVAVHAHPGRPYTQGLLWTRDLVFESGGGYGRSVLRKWRLASGEVVAEVALGDDLFAEGLALAEGRLVLLTWKEGVAFFYRPEDLALTGEASYRGEGWGLTYDGENLIQSDGSHVLTFRDPSSLEVRRRLPVRRRGGIQDSLNELEYVEGSLYANVYQTDRIVRIDPETGHVTAVIDAGGLLTDREAAAAEVLNGIAYRAETGTFLLTGKEWPKVFEVKLKAAGSGE